MALCFGEIDVGFLAQLLGAIMGAAAGFGLGEMIIVGVEGETTSLGLYVGAAGMVLGYLIGRFVAGRYEAETSRPVE